MFSIFLSLVIPLLSVFTVSSNALPSSRNIISSSLSLPIVLKTLHTNNTSRQDLASPVSSYSPDCSISYGRYLNQASCNSALAKISQVTTPITFGERGTGTWDVVLPRRYLSDDGQCAIDVKVDLNGAQRDVSNYLQITNAASAVLRDCVQMRQPSTGGLVTNLGIRYRSLSAEISRYYPNVECRDQTTSAPPSYDSCKDILDTMQWSESLTNFGLPWQVRLVAEIPLC
ncbi:hypothetical protein HO173_010789 [Letharia columbiana]|uniref:Uncharacterized protein n=1 Tax=Letharia columbiana TaxID=112416 RepID=A0A8H6L0K5_9LECA|nr:uncharacterized protein HO173_010789 [Letharia columbiana]KAF6231089.1 hypothetical protein HO173_010789 [Letharia columbiana]